MARPKLSPAEKLRAVVAELDNWIKAYGQSVSEDARAAYEEMVARVKAIAEL